LFFFPRQALAGLARLAGLAGCSLPVFTGLAALAGDLRALPEAALSFSERFSLRGF
jgi:hypothetical protein